MFIALLLLFAAACCTTNGHSVEGPRNYYSQFFLRNSRIVGGVDAPEEYGKHMASLIYGSPPWNAFVCGGSIISKRHILSAAHCIDIFVLWNQQLYRTFRALLGTKDWSSGDEYTFIDYAIHSGWDWNTIKNDIGVLKVNRDIVTSDQVAILPLKFDRVGGGVNAFVTGWGMTSDWFDSPDTLQLLYVNTLTHEDCSERMREANDEIGPAPLVQEDIEICTLFSKGHGMCNGDSGSALVEKDSQKQIGIVSWGFPCATGAPDVFARISGFEEWLRSNTEGELE